MTFLQQIWVFSFLGGETNFGIGGGNLPLALERFADNTPSAVSMLR